MCFKLRLFFYKNGCNSTKSSMILFKFSVALNVIFTKMFPKLMQNVLKQKDFKNISQVLKLCSFHLNMQYIFEHFLLKGWHFRGPAQAPVNLFKLLPFLL